MRRLFARDEHSTDFASSRNFQSPWTLAQKNIKKIPLVVLVSVSVPGTEVHRISFSKNQWCVQ